MRDLRSAIESLQRELGPEVLAPPDEPSRYTVDGQEPLALAQPGTVDELAAILRLATEHNVPVAPYGSGSFVHLGAPPAAAGMALSLARLNTIVAHEPADLTVTVQAGVTLGDLQRCLGEHDQCLPLDPACSDEATIGGIVAAGASGPSRFRYGTSADMLLGMRAVAATGEPMKAGGRVVKNVAGYDLTRLFVGSLGTLGVLTELTFKVWPRLPERAMVVGWCESCEQAQQVAAALVASQLEPAFVELLNGRSLGRADHWPLSTDDGGSAAVIAGFWGTDAETSYQLTEAKALFLETGARPEGVRGEDERAARLWLRTLVPRIGGGPAGLVTMKLSVLSSDVAKVISKAGQLAGDFGWRCAAQAHAGNGIVYVIVEAPSPIDEPFERVAGLCEELRAETQRLGGWAIIERGPVAVKKLAGVWGNTGAQWELMASIKRAFDPAGILNPGRLTDGR